MIIIRHFDIFARWQRCDIVNAETQPGTTPGRRVITLVITVYIYRCHSLPVLNPRYNPRYSKFSECFNSIYTSYSESYGSDFRVEPIITYSQNALCFLSAPRVHTSHSECSSEIYT